ncbi:ATP-binding protein [Amycolatopsis sp. OK19-0408]|uniref:ATP-binding protein n=1 Tax=Amycolatopsis iheyensis TaxID=2945988 RepID=A0A9X2NGA8_9PSEU|nr:ATP-binding protein [Amycolatopsis iheyensis]MCR6487198.1 ATP-binding protein [Amycolatopsis iheyensis]
MTAADDQPLYGRDALVRTIWETVLERPRDNPPGGWPIIALYGPRGSGKTAVVNHLVEKSIRQAAQPFARLDLARLDEQAWGSRVIGELAYELTNAKWAQFGRLKFPRFAVGRMIVEGDVATDSPEETQSAIEKLLKEARKLDQASTNVEALTGQLPQLLDLAGWLSLVGKVGAWAIRSRAIVRFLFQTALAFYGEALQRPPNAGFSALVELGRLGSRPDDESRRRLDLVLCEAFLADLGASYEHGFRPRNCLVLLDNAHSPVGQRTLAAFAAAKANRAPAADPLVAVVTSRDVRDSAQVLVRPGRRPDVLSRWADLPADDAAARVVKRAPEHGSPVVALRLADLTLENVAAIENREFPDNVRPLAPFVHSLTRGHPWGVHKVFQACAALDARKRGLREEDLRRVLDTQCHGDSVALGELAGDLLLLEDLPRTGQDILVWAAARDVVAAENTFPDSAGLQTDVGALCWLVRPAATPGRAGPYGVLHPWLRRILLRRLANRKTGMPWNDVYAKLAAHSGGASTALDVHYCELATGVIAPAVTVLNQRFDVVAADRWIAEFDEITSAPSRWPVDGDVHEHYSRLVRGVGTEPPGGRLPTADPHGDRWTTIAGMTVARWIWADPLGDPAVAMSRRIAIGYQDLARRSPEGQPRLIVEAETYEQRLRP